MDQMDDVDIYGTFTEAEAKRIGVAPLESTAIDGLAASKGPSDNIVIVEDGKGF